MVLSKMAAGEKFPEMQLSTVNHGVTRLGGEHVNGKWQMIVVYRGKHCPICNRYLTGLEALIPDYEEQNVEVIAISGDGQEKAGIVAEENGLSFPVGYNLSTDQMRQLGLYISDPRSPKETDQPFPEPGLYVLRPDGTLQITDISNAPFSRPDLKAVLNGIKFIQANDYPIRGTH
jgi:peroxiredoxin